MRIINLKNYYLYDRKIFEELKIHLEINQMLQSSFYFFLLNQVYMTNFKIISNFTRVNKYYFLRWEKWSNVA